MKKTKRFLALILAGVMAFSMMSCGGTEDEDKSGAGGSGGSQSQVEAGASISQNHDLVAAVEVDITTLDPVDTSDTLSGGIQRLMLDGLFGFDDEMGLIPMLATEYTANDNATEYVITLREGISFTDGTPWDANAAKANFDKLCDKELALKRTTLLTNVIKETTIVDDTHIKVALNEPFGAFISTLAHPAVVMNSPKLIAEGTEACRTNAIGTGQYKFVEWIENDHVKVELNKDWWGYKPELNDGTALADPDAGFKTITFKPTPESSTRTAMLQSGDAQMIWKAPSESMSVLKNDKTLRVEAEDALVVRYLFMNNKKEKFSDVRVRQAIDLAIDKDAYAQIVWDGYATPPTSVLAPQVQFYKANDVVKQDIEKAKKLLADAGYPEGFSCTLHAASTTLNQKQTDFIRQQLSLIGVDVKVILEDNAIVQDKIQAATGDGKDVLVEMYLSGWSPSTGDADWGMRPVLASESLPPNSFNVSYYTSEEMDALFAEALSSADDAIRAEAYAKAQDLFWNDVPLVCLGVDQNTWAHSAKIVNIGLYPDGALNIRNAKMYEEDQE